MNPTRVALVTNVLAHYRLPCFRSLAGQISGSIDFYCLSRGMEHRRYVMSVEEENFPATLLRGWKTRRYPHDDCHLSDIRPLLKKNPDTIILGGWDEPTYLLLWAWGVARRKKLIFWVESTEKDGVRQRLKESWKRLLLRRARGCIVPGKNAFKYCRRLGMPEENIFTAPNATDREYFRRKADDLLPRREVLRKQARLEGFLVLFVGRLVESLKGVSTLIQACARVQSEGAGVSLLIAGDGPDRKRYEQLIAAEGLKSYRFLGTLDHEELCRYYAMSHVLVQPSRSEPWGFVLNEGMEFGLPLVVSNAVGAGPDLVRNGENGFTFPMGDGSSLACLLQKLYKNKELCSSMATASRRIVQEFSPDHWAKGVLTALEAANASIRKQPHRLLV